MARDGAQTEILRVAIVSELNIPTAVLTAKSYPAAGGDTHTEETFDCGTHAAQVTPAQLIDPNLELTVSDLPDGAAKELSGDTTLHEEPYAIRINDEFTVDVMNSASGFTWEALAPFRVRVDGVTVLSLEGLLRMKEHGRLKDRADAEAIRKALGLEEGSY